MKVLYFDCFAGASGNMILGALVGLGVDQKALTGQIALLDIPAFEIEFSTVDRSGISSIHAEVKVPNEHVHRHLKDIEKIIIGSRLNDSVKQRALKIFTRLAEAEAKIHGIDIQEVHFHEVGAMDAIIDVVGACIGSEMLGVEHFACSKINVGSGFADMTHGKYPIPPPAVAELVRGFPIYSTDIEGELMTPTGAAIISTLCIGYNLNINVIPEVVGYGAGTREYQNFPNVLRVILGETTPLAADQLTLLETNIDDLSPQVLGFVMERSFEIGALDCWFTPIQMKKNRPAVMISILCEPEKREKFAELLYSETTTLGVRVRQIERECLEREMTPVQSKYGPVDVKIARYKGKIVNTMPEYEQVKSLALKNNLPFRLVRDAVMEAIAKGAASKVNG